MSYRFDSRSREEFEKDIERYILREKYLADLFVAELRHLGSKAELYPHAAGNDGRFLTVASQAADYRLSLNGRNFLLEIKLASSPKIATFKVSDLEAYIKQGASILLFYSPRRFVRSIEDLESERNHLVYDVVDIDTQQRILHNHKPFRFKGLGNKMSVQVLKKNFADYFDFKRLTHTLARNSDNDDET